MPLYPESRRSYDSVATLGEECFVEQQPLVPGEEAGLTSSSYQKGDAVPSGTSGGADARCVVFGKVLGGMLVLCAIAIIAVVGLTDEGDALISTVLNRSSRGSDSSSSGISSSEPYSSADEATQDTDATDEITYAPFDSTELGFQRRGYSRLPYWGEDKSEVIMYEFLKKYDSLIEPNVDMHFGYYGSDEVDDDSLDYYTYAAYDSKTDELKDSGYYYMCKSSKGVSTDITVDCSPFEELRVDVRRFDRYGNELFQFNLTAVCMYVRREIRTLSDADLNSTMNAMYAMWDPEIGETKGQKAYGDNFHSSSWFAGMHDFNAAWSDGDHIHEGLGFLPQHMKMTNMFEASMQAVDPSVSMFYWDFTIEATLSESFFNSPMFTADTFGSLSKSSADSTVNAWSYGYDSISDSYISDGRWAHAKANINDYADLASPFGYMRGPWNANPAPKITRFAQDDLMLQNIPSCKVYMNWLETNDFGDFLSTSENAPHASIHGGIGGVWGCSVLDELYDAGYVGVDPSGEDYRDDICYKWPFYMKELYRADILRFRSDCSTDSDLSFAGTECGYECNEEKIDSVKDVLSGLTLKNYVSDASSDDLWEAYKDFVCYGNAYRIFSGDHLESASPADPSFWPIHPTQERLLQAKMFAGGFDAWTWPNTTGASSPMSTVSYDWVCNHAECYDYSDKSDDKDKDFLSSCCAGHFEDDALFDFESGDRERQFGPTNRQVLADADPTSEAYGLPYVYDNFDWSHCSKLAGYDLYAAIIDLNANATATGRIDSLKPWQ